MKIMTFEVVLCRDPLSEFSKTLKTLYLVSKRKPEQFLDQTKGALEYYSKLFQHEKVRRS